MSESNKAGFWYRLAHITTGTVAKYFLYLVSILYIILGILSLAGLVIFAWPISWFLIIPIAVFNNLYALPSPFVLKILGLLAIFGGIVGAKGARMMLRNEKKGFKIWFYLVCISIATAFFNLIWIKYYNIQYISPGVLSIWSPKGIRGTLGELSIFWAIFWSFCYLISWREYKNYLLNISKENIQKQ